MYEKELFDETLDINSTSNYDISIQVSLNGFSFCLLDIHRNKFVMLREYKLSGRDDELSKQIEEIIYKDDFLGKPYHKYRLVYIFEKNTLVPAGLFDPAVKDDFFTLNYSLEDNYIVSNNRVPEPDSFLLFDVRQDLQDLLIKAFPEASLSHHAKPLLFSCFGNAVKQNNRYIHINIEDCYFNIVIINERKMEFLNTFRYRNSSDILYYLLFTFEKMGISKDETVHLTGLIEKGDELYNNMLRYVSKIEFEKPIGNWSLSYIFESIDIHRYSNLFNIVNCV
jgi:hypothetical protein